MAASVTRLWPYLLLGVVAYLVSLAVTLPAATAYPWLQQRLGLPAITQLSGSLVEGQGRGLALGGVRLDQLDWSLRPADLLLGRLGFDTRARSALLGRIDGRLALGLGGGISANGLQARTDADTLSRHVSGQAGLLGGRVDLDLQALAVDGQRLEALAGELVWRDAGLLQPQAVPLGELHLTLSHTDKGVTGVIKDAGGPLKAEGEIEIAAGGQYRLHATLLARDANNTALRSALAWLGRADARGRVEVDLKGRLPNWPFGA